MPNLPIRGLGTVGVITDAAPHDLPESAWSDARNVRFLNESVVRSSVFKPFTLQQNFTASDPLWMVDDSLWSTTKSVTTVRANGTLTRISEGLITDASPTTAMSAIIGNVTGAIVGSVSYINTTNNRPISIAHGEARYSYIPHWPTNDRCLSLRKYRDFLIALNVTKNNTTEFPNMVKWSDAIQVGTRPSWDVAALNGLAGENVLNDSTGYIVDGLELGNSFMIYGTREAWRMDYIGGELVFSFDKVFNDFSIMTQNCAVEVNSKHYVFCEDDIVVTDGITRESICDQKIRGRVFQSVDFAKRDQCRVILNSIKNEILFCYPSSSSAAAWEAGDLGCNEAAVFNYSTGTWSFIDLPNVTHGHEVAHPVGSVALANTWDGLATWNNLKSNWSFAPASPMTLILSGGSNGTRRGNVFFFDDDVDGRIGNPADLTIYWPAWAEMRLCDFDALGLPVVASKLVKMIAPQVIVPDPGQFVNFYVMADMNNRSEANWTAPMPFYPFEHYKLNCRASGRYISIRYEIPFGTSASLSGFDLELVKIAGR